MRTRARTDRPILFSTPMIRALLAGRKTMTRRLLSPEYLRIFTGGPYDPVKLIKPSRELFEAAMQEASDFRIIDNVFLWQARAFDHQAPATRTHWQGELKFAKGQHLWVRESFCGPIYKLDDNDRPIGPREYFYRADGYPFNGYIDPDTGIRRNEAPWHPSIHMPRSLSRLTLDVTSVKIERLDDLTEEDAIAEGIEPLKSGRGFYDPRFEHGAVRTGNYFHTARDAFVALWDHLHGEDAWAETKDKLVVTPSFSVHQENIDTFSKRAA